MGCRQFSSLERRCAVSRIVQSVPMRSLAATLGPPTHRDLLAIEGVLSKPSQEVLRRTSYGLRECCTERARRPESNRQGDFADTPLSFTELILSQGHSPIPQILDGARSHDLAKSACKRGPRDAADPRQFGYRPAVREAGEQATLVWVHTRRLTGMKFRTGLRCRKLTALTVSRQNCTKAAWHAL